MEENKTPCECPLAGFCNRHGIKKTEHYHKLCQNHTGYFNMWEECRGPGQTFTDCTEKRTPEEIQASVEEVKAKAEAAQVKNCELCGKGGCNGACKRTRRNVQHTLPSKIQMAKNLASATVEHAKTGFANVTSDEQQARLDICKGCEFYREADDRCLKCGCFLKSKSAWKSGKCPIGKW
jgi:hypothetical protein